LTIPIVYFQFPITLRQARIFIFGAQGLFQIGVLSKDLCMMSYQLASHVLATLTQVVPNHQYISSFCKAAVKLSDHRTIT